MFELILKWHVTFSPENKFETNFEPCHFELCPLNKKHISNSVISNFVSQPDILNIFKIFNCFKFVLWDRERFIISIS